jgi:hypothetical protein
MLLLCDVLASVLSGRTPEACMARAAAITATTPVPSSVAPGLRSQESRCAPIRTTCSGCTAPSISPTTFSAEIGLSVKRLATFNRTLGLARCLTRRSNRCRCISGISRMGTEDSRPGKPSGPVCSMPPGREMPSITATAWTFSAHFARTGASATPRIPSFERSNQDDLAPPIPCGHFGKRCVAIHKYDLARNSTIS